VFDLPGGVAGFNPLLDEDDLPSGGPRVGFGAQASYHCRISPPRFLAECRKRRLNQGSFVVLYFNLSASSDLYLVFCMFIFLYCFVCQYQSSDWL